MINERSPNLDLYEFDLQFWTLAKAISEKNPLDAKNIGINLECAEALAAAEKKSLIQLASGVMLSFQLISDESNIIDFLNRPYSPSLSYQNRKDRFDLAYWLKMKELAKTSIEFTAFFYGVSSDLVTAISRCTDSHLERMSLKFPTKLKLRFPNKVLMEFLMHDQKKLSQKALKNLMFLRVQTTEMPTTITTHEEGI